MAKCFLEFQGLELGEKQPFPEYMKRWRELIAIYRTIKAAEHCIIGDDRVPGLSTEERIEVVKKYIAEGEDSMYRQALLNMGHKYLEQKYNQAEIEAELNEYYSKQI